MKTTKTNSYFKFELLNKDYKKLIKEFNKQNIDEALYKLDRELLTGKKK